MENINTVEVGKSYKIYSPTIKATIHIEHILPSIYTDEYLVIYRFYNKRKGWLYDIKTLDYIQFEINNFLDK